MQKIKTVNVAALCEKGGRKANQDSIFLSCQNSLIQVDAGNHTVLSAEELPIPPEGTLLVVADGMGGMNAGEVASQLVVETLAREMQSLDGKTLDDTEYVSTLARRAIDDADKAIKQYVAEHPEGSGTGSTVVILWLLADKAVVAWCGDSRCYRYNPLRGLEQLSHDHSYVQQLVDEGKLRPELAFGHDQRNIITRCLSDDNQQAEPEVKVIDVYRDDIFLLCSDGLCGLLPDDVIRQQVKDADGDVGRALVNCWCRGEAEGWNDNVSIIFAAVNGFDTMAPERKPEPVPQRPAYTTVTVELDDSQNEKAVDVELIVQDSSKPKLKKWSIVILALLILAVVVILCVPKNNKNQEPDTRPDVEVVEATQPNPGKEITATNHETIESEPQTESITVESAEENQNNQNNDGHAGFMQASGK